MVFTLCRFQEHFESPKFNGKHFELTEFLSWFKEKYHCSYLEEWTRFNIPWNILNAFRSGAFDPLSEREKHLLFATQHISSPFYLIASLQGDLETLNHEIAHAFFHLSAECRSKVLQILG